MAATEPQLSEVPNGGWDVRLRVFRAGDEVDTFALVTARYVVLVDTMSTPELAEDILDRVRPDVQGRQLLVVNTHADWDHCWGNAAFTMPRGSITAPILGHELAAARLGGPEERETLARKRAEESRFASVRLVAPTITFRDGLRIAGGDLTLELLPTPGHTPDHIAVWVPELRLLLAGDAAEQPFPSVHGGEALAVLRGTLERMRELGPTHVFPCHGGTTDAELLARNLAYFDALERAARATIMAGRLPGDWETRADLPEIVDQPFATALRMAGADPQATSAIYRQFHLEAVRAALAFVLSQAGAVR
jgi:glyoxylase-like metal-dependent hydrolase (beta-lactamase superfamily II)